MLYGWIYVYNFMIEKFFVYRYKFKNYFYEFYNKMVDR